MPYVELRAHTAFSFGNGSAPPEALIRRARQLGYTHLGVTDSADLGGMPRCVREATHPPKDDHCVLAAQHQPAPCPICQRPLQIIVGAELCIDGQAAAFLARNEQGYHNLAALVTLARVGEWSGWEKDAQQARRGRPGISWEQLAAHSEGLHALTGPASGPLASLVQRGDGCGADRLLEQWHEAFADRLAVEVQMHHAGGHESALAGALIALAERHQLPWVVAHDPRYVDDAGRLVHDILTTLRHEMTIDEATAARRAAPQWRVAAAGAGGDAAAAVAGARGGTQRKRAHLPHAVKLTLLVDASSPSQVQRSLWRRR